MEITKIPCFLCGNQIEVKNTIKGKPYFICDPCGLQAFIRRAKGEERLKEWMEGKAEVFKKRSGGALLEWVAQLEEVKAKLEDVDDKRGFFPDEDTKLVIAALKAEIEGIKNRIKKGMKGKNSSGE
jgi:hypothetical protein